MVKNLPSVLDIQVPFLGRKSSQRQEWLPTPVLLPREFHGQRSLASYSLWGHKELDMTKQLTLSHSCNMYIYTYININIYIYIYLQLLLVVKSCLSLFGHRGLQLAWLFCPWNSPGKDTGVGCDFLLQGIFLTQGSNPSLLHWLADSLPGQAHMYGASLVAQLVKNLSAMQETWVQSLGWKNPLEKGIAIHSSILAWRIPWSGKELDMIEPLLLSLSHIYIYGYIHAFNMQVS